MNFEDLEAMNTPTLSLRTNLSHPLLVQIVQCLELQPCFYQMTEVFLYLHPDTANYKFWGYSVQSI